MSKTSDDCGCCAGTAIDTPAAKFNAPGLPVVAYRVGTYAEFKSALLARLSNTDFPALAALTTRAPDDWTIALGDAFACVADVLSFYQERIANESWLRTATERRSVLELARLIGYPLAPGVAASTTLAFTLEGAPGQPLLAAQPVTIPAGTRVQSVPGPGQSPQTFESVAAITARLEWNAIPVQTREEITFWPGRTELYIAGLNNQVQPGDAILIIDVSSTRWDLRWVNAVQPDSDRGITRLAWSQGLSSETWNASSAPSVTVFVFRQWAALFGSNAPDPALLTGIAGLQLPTKGSDWANDSIHDTQIDLDAPYPKIVNGSWVALVGSTNGTAPNVALCKVAGTTLMSRAAYAMSARLTRLSVDSATTLDPHNFGLRETAVLGQSDALKLALRPLLYPVYGSELALGMLDLKLQPGQLIAVSGKRQRVAIPPETTGITFLNETAPAPTRLPRAGESFVMLAAPEVQIGADTWQALDPQDLDPQQPGPPQLAAAAAERTIWWRWSVIDHDGSTVRIKAPAGRLLLQAARGGDAKVAESTAIAQGAEGVRHASDSTTLTLVTPLANCYDRATVVVNANVAPATHGESVTEIGGSGDAALANQSFVLKQAPLTYVSSSSDPSGAVSTLQTWVDDLLWNERSTLYGSTRKERVYSSRQDDAGKTTVEFGDGMEGARLPSALNNVRFNYRKGGGVAGNLLPDQLTTLLAQPLGVKAVTNPAPATEGQDAQTLDHARSNAPLRVLTLDRAVSTQDYADFARAFAGITKAHAMWVASGRARGIYLSVAGSDGSAIPDGGATHRNLLSALRRFGDPLLPLSVRNYNAARFTLQATVKIAANVDAGKTLAAVETALRQIYAFDAREFGQPVTLDEAYAVIQGVAGVVAADIQQLYRIDAGPADPQPKPRLPAALPALLADGTVTVAELLTLDDGALSLGIMS